MRVHDRAGKTSAGSQAGHSRSDRPALMQGAYAAAERWSPTLGEILPPSSFRRGGRGRESAGCSRPDSGRRRRSPPPGRRSSGSPRKNRRHRLGAPPRLGGLENSRHRKRPPVLRTRRASLSAARCRSRCAVQRRCNRRRPRRRPVGSACASPAAHRIPARPARVRPASSMPTVLVHHDDCRRLAASPLRRRRRHSRQARGHVAGAPGAIDDHLAGLGIESGRRGVLPQAVHSGAHQIVHQVVAGRDGLEDAADEAGLGVRIDVGEAETCGAVVAALSMVGLLVQHRPDAPANLGGAWRAGRLGGRPCPNYPRSRPSGGVWSR